jgi:hypothetical protein
VSELFADGFNPLTIPFGTPFVTVTGILIDNTTTDENQPLITGAEWYDGVPPGTAIGNPVDGTWDGPLETLNFDIITAAWLGGDHLVNVRGISPPGSGPSEIVTVTVIGSNFDIDLGGVADDTWVFVSFPLSLSGQAITIIDDSTWGDSGTTWDLLQWYDPLDTADHWKSYSSDKPALLNDLPDVNNAMGLWIHITGNDGDQILTVGSGAYSGSAVDIQLYSGWNLVGYPSTTSRRADLTLPAQVTKLGVYDLAQPYGIRDVSDLTSVFFVEGEAYWVYANADTIWSVTP